MCFRCDARDDAIAFVQRIENISFRDAASRLGGALAPGPAALTRHRLKTTRHGAVRPIDTEVLAAALELYSNRRIQRLGRARYEALVAQRSGERAQVHESDYLEDLPF